MSWRTIKATYKNDDAETSRRKQQVDPGLDLAVLDVESWWDHSSFVETTIELNNNFSRSVVVDDFEFTDVTDKGIPVEPAYILSK